MASRLRTIQRRYNFDARRGRAQLGAQPRDHGLVEAYGEFKCLVKVADFLQIPVPYDPAGVDPTQGCANEKATKKVYFIQRSDENVVKIGIATDPHARLRALQTGQDKPLHLLGYMEASEAVERALHRRFHKHKTRDKKDLRKGEWFALPYLLTRRQVERLIVEVGKEIDSG